LQASASETGYGNRDRFRQSATWVCTRKNSLTRGGRECFCTADRAAGRILLSPGGARCTISLVVPGAGARKHSNDDDEDGRTRFPDIHEDAELFLAGEMYVSL